MGLRGGMGDHQPTCSVTQALAALASEVASCRACPRLVAWREQVAREKRAAFADQEYWGRPVPSLGDPAARLLVVGLAPAAHGGNRTGRMFTGDRSGDWLFSALYRAGYTNQPSSLGLGDGLCLQGAYVTAAVRCAPPANKPTVNERDTCAAFLEREVALLHEVRVVVALGSFAFTAVSKLLRLRPRPKFGHLVEAQAGGLSVLCSYHPSQQNTFPGTLTREMFDAVFDRARELGA